MARAVSEEGGKVKIRPELMEDDRMYHCVVGGRLMLVYRDAQGVTHCYEVEDEAVVGAVRSCASYGEAERLLEGMGAGGMNRVINQQDPRGATMSAESDAARVYSEYTSSSEGAGDPPAGAGGGGSCGCGGEAGTCDDKASGGHDAPQGGSESPEAGGDGRAEGEGHDGGRPEGQGGAGSHDAPQGGERRDGGRPEGEQRDRSVVLIGIKPIMTYVTATLTQLATLPKITIKARGKRITQAVDVSQMIVKRMNTVGYEISDVRIASDSFTGEDGKSRKISTMEIDIIKKS